MNTLDTYSRLIEMRQLLDENPTKGKQLLTNLIKNIKLILEKK